MQQEELVEEYEVIGFGRDYDNEGVGRLNHVRLKLTKLEEARDG